MFNIEEKIESGEIDLENPKVVRTVINNIALEIERLGLKKAHVAANVVPSESSPTLSHFLAMNDRYVNYDRIVKYCNYLDNVRT